MRPRRVDFGSFLLSACSTGVVRWRRIMVTPHKPIQLVPNELYIEPTSVCNLKCKMCYTNVINGPDRLVVPSDRILTLIQRFAASTEGPFTIYWCGTGEI